ncbi:MAG: DEAD/DEAH box helicase [Solirubrobacterales bacterium]
MADYFKATSRRPRLDPALVEAERLREAQLGACSAIVAHASSSEAPAQIVMPTGVGKSLVLTAAPFLLRAQKALVVAPARLVRDQLAQGFKTLTQLKAAGLLPEDAKTPKVVIARRQATEDDWEKWKDADVVVGTVNVLSAGYPGVTRIPRDMFELVLFDEAHHLPAKTWTALLASVDARAVLLTATPFRRDRKRLPGEIAFDYPLARAIARGAYSPVRFLAVEPEDGADKDLALAEAAQERVLSDEHKEAGSKLLVRTDRIEDANKLVDLYSKLGVNLGLIEASTSARAANKTLEAVKADELQGFACVGALIEGFDFPTLKVAAYHVPHRSLPPTLQFIGRLSRVTTIQGELIADPRDISRDTATLYRSGQEWEELLPQMVDSAVDEEKATRKFVRQAATHNQGEEIVPWLAITPPRSVQVYELTDRPPLDLQLDRLGKVPAVQSLYQAENDLYAAVTEELLRPRFLKSDHLDGTLYRLHTATWVEEHGLLFLSSDRPSALKEMRELLGATHAPLIGAKALRRLLNSVAGDRFFSVGLRESRARQAMLASYEMKAGRNADQAVAEEDADFKLLGHAMGKTEEGSFGISTGKSKFWEPKAAENLLEFRKWCVACAHMIRKEQAAAGGALDRFRIADHLMHFPEHPLAGLISEALLPERCLLLRNGRRRIDLLELDVVVRRLDERTLRIALEIEGDELVALRQDINGTVSFEPVGEEDPAFILEEGTGELTPLATAFESRPPIIFFGDGSFIEGAKGALIPEPVAGPPPSFTVEQEWDDVDTTAEVGGAADGKMTIQEGTVARLQDGARWIIRDHSSQELADFIWIGDADDGAVKVTFVHCKGSSEPPGGRVEDLYDVLGQAIRSARWCRPGPSFWAELQRRLDERAATIPIAGDTDDLVEALGSWSQDNAPMTIFQVLVVQPGLRRSKSGSNANVLTLLRATHAHIHDQDAEFLVWVNGG